MAKQKSPRTQQDRDLERDKMNFEYLKIAQRAESFRVAWKAVVAGVVVLVLGLFAVRTAESVIPILAGQQTVANFNVNVNIAATVSFALGGAGLVYGVSQRRLRGKDVERLGDELSDCKDKLHPDRGHSNLNVDGTTAKEDR